MLCRCAVLGRRAPGAPCDPGGAQHEDDAEDEGRFRQPLRREGQDEAGVGYAEPAADGGDGGGEQKQGKSEAEERFAVLADAPMAGTAQDEGSALHYAALLSGAGGVFLSQ